MASDEPAHQPGHRLRFNDWTITSECSCGSNSDTTKTDRGDGTVLHRTTCRRSGALLNETIHGWPRSLARRGER